MKNLLLLCLLLFATNLLFAQVSITQNTLSYYQDFNTLDTVTSNTRTALPAGWAIAEHGTSANWKYRTGDGSVTTNDIYSFGKALSTERALGSIGGSTVDTMYYGMQFRNDIGADISLANISYKAEQWRSGDTGLAFIDSVQVFYSFTADSIGDNAATASWTEVPSLLMTSVVLDKYAVALNGDSAAKVITSPVNIVVPSGAKLWLRWRDWNSRGSDDGLAIDSLTVKFGTLRAIVVDKFPATNTTHIALPTMPVRILFDQPVQKSLGSIYIKNETDQQVQIIAASSGSVVVHDTVVLINGVNLQPTKTYHITFDSSAFVSFTGYSSFGIRDTSEWRFSTRIPTGVSSLNIGDVRMTVLGIGSTSNIDLYLAAKQSFPAVLSVSDMAGREVYQTKIQINIGESIYHLQPDGLQAGIYLIRLAGSGFTGFTKCLIQ